MSDAQRRSAPAQGSHDEMAALIETKDWSCSPLGLASGWPPALASAVQLMKASGFPMFLAWGPELTLVYNDAYRPILGDKHPKALGARFSDVWHEIWDDIRLLVDRALAGEASFVRDMPLVMMRSGHEEKTWFTFSYSPLRDEHGMVRGMFCACTETTEQVVANALKDRDIQAERLRQSRQAALIELDDTLADLRDPVDLGEAASRIVGEALAASRVGYGVIDAAARRISIDRDWVAAGQTSVAGQHRFDDYGSYVDDLLAGRPAVVVDTRVDPRTAGKADALLHYDIQALLDVPAVEEGRTVAQILVHSDQPREWTLEEIAFVRAVAERTRAAVARREAEQRLERGQEELRRLADNLPLLVSSVDRELRYVFTNKGYEDWFGEPSDKFRGRSIREVLGEPVFALMRPHFKRVLAGHRVSMDQLMPYSRGGMRYVHTELIPRSDGASAVEGFYAVVQDITDRRDADLRRRVLVDLDDAIRDLTDAGQIAHASARILANALSVSRVGYGVMDTRAETVTIDRDYNAPGVQSIAGIIHFRDFGSYIEHLSRGEVVVIDDAAMDDRVADGGAALDRIQARALINLPLVEQGRVVALLFVNSAAPRSWSEADVALVREVAERVRTATERAKANLALRDNEARLRFLDELNRQVARLSEADEILSCTTRMTARHLGVDNCAYADMDADEDGFTIRGDWHAADMASIVGHYRLVDFGRLAVERLSAGLPLVINDNLSEIPSEEAATFQALGISATICMPLVKQGRLTALMAIHHRHAHPWTGEELATLREVTERSWAHIERVRADAELRESEARFRNMADNTPMMMWVTDPGGRCIYRNRTWYDYTGHPQAEAGEGDWLEASHPDDEPAARMAFQTASSSRSPVRFEFRLRRADGQYRWAINAAQPRFGSDGGYLGYVGSVIDIDDRREIEDALRAREAELSELNATLEDRVAERSHELQAAHESLRQSQKMEAVGQLTGGIAHDFNNLLAGISGALELLSKRMAQGRLDGMERYIEAAQGSAQRAAALTQRLLAFSRRQTLAPKPTDVNRLIDGMEDLIRRSVGPTVELEVIRAEDLWLTLIDQSQLENALLNLCINARDAMAPEGGHLTIETANTRLDATSAKQRDLTPGQYVTLCVTDTGTGMSPEVQARAFDPFFTTKPLGQGTGLGLSMIHGFVRQSKGQVSITTEVGAGTTICLYLPHFEGALAVDEVETTMSLPDVGHGETVLVIDDEATVRMLVTEVLQQAGFKVLEAPDGPSGLEILRAKGHIDLLITDVGLPGGLNGRQVADAARATRPELRVLFITGYAEAAAVGDGLLAPGMEVMTKPFAIADLAAKVRELIVE